MDATAIHRLESLLMAAVCTDIEYTGGIPFIRFGATGLWVASAWRTVSNLEIVAGSDSDEGVKNELLHLLVGQQVSQVSTHGDFHDLVIKFQSGITLEMFANAEGYEHWNVVAGPDNMVIAGPGRSWSSF